MSVADALYNLVHEYPGGSKALASRMEKARSTLLSMANPACTSHNWSLGDFRKALAFSGDMRPLEALCQEFGGVFMPVGRFDGMAPNRVLKALQHLTKEFSDVPVRMADIMKDGQVKPREVERMRREIYEMQQAGAAVLKVLEGLCESHVRVPEEERPL